MARNFNCPHCSARVTVPAAFNRTHVTCPRCRQPIEVPDETAPETFDPMSADSPTAADRVDESYTCSACGGEFDVDEVYDIQGTITCHSCYAKPKAPPATPSASGAPRPRAVRSTPALFVAPPLEDIASPDSADDAAPIPDDEPEAPAAATEDPAGEEGDLVAAVSTVTSRATRTPPKRSSSLFFVIIGVVAVGLIAASAYVWLREPDRRPVVINPPPDTAPTAPTTNPPRIDRSAPTTQRAKPPTEGPVRRETPEATPGDVDEPATPPKTVVTPKPKPKPEPPKPKPETPKVEPAPPPRTAKTVPADDPAEAAEVAEALAVVAEAEELGKKADKFAALAAYEDAVERLAKLSAANNAEVKKARTRATKARRELLAAVRDSEEARRRTAGALLEQGHRALADAKWKAAIESLGDVKQLVEYRVKSAAERVRDEDYTAALHGLAIAYARNNQVPRAAQMFDDASVLGRITKTSPRRDLVWNRAVVDLTQKYRTVRAVIDIKNFMEKQPQVDEDLLNLLGSSIYQAEKDPPENRRMLDQCIAYYLKANAQLEATRPGYMHWGTEWITGAEKSRLEAERARTQAIYNTERAKFDDISRRLSVAKKGRKVRVGGRGRIRRTITVVDHELVARLRQEFEPQKEKTTAARLAMPRPTWLTEFDYILPDAATQPPTAVASANPSSARPTPPPPVTRTDLEPPPTVASADTDPEPVMSDDDEPDEPAVSAPTETIAAAPITPARRPSFIRRHAAAFPVAPLKLLTAAEPLGSATEVQVEDPNGVPLVARVVARNDTLALLELNPQDVGGNTPYMNLASGFGGGAIRCAGIPVPTIFGYSVQMLQGTSPAPPADGAWEISLNTHPRLPGAPVFDGSGRVVGVSIAGRDDPVKKLPAVALSDLAEFLRANGGAPPAPCANPNAEGVYHVTIEE